MIHQETENSLNLFKRLFSPRVIVSFSDWSTNRPYRLRDGRGIRHNSNQEKRKLSEQLNKKRLNQRTGGRKVQKANERRERKKGT